MDKVSKYANLVVKALFSLKGKVYWGTRGVQDTLILGCLICPKMIRDFLSKIKKRKKY